MLPTLIPLLLALQSLQQFSGVEAGPASSSSSLGVATTSSKKLLASLGIGRAKTAAPTTSLALGRRPIATQSAASSSKVSTSSSPSSTSSTAPSSTVTLSSTSSTAPSSTSSTSSTSTSTSISSSQVSTSSLALNSSSTLSSSSSSIAPIPTSGSGPIAGSGLAVKQCLDGSLYQGPMNQCHLPLQSGVIYASGWNYSRYLNVDAQPKFHLEAVAELLDARVDPVVNPGMQQTPHTHTFFGGSMINPDLTYEQTQQASCTSISVRADKSSYWFPTLYNKGPQGFERISILGQRFYYLMHHWVIKAPAPLKSFEERITAFPPGFRMLIGNPTRRTYDPNNVGEWATSNWWCDKGNGDVKMWNQAPQGCKYIKISTLFPSCWDGVNLYLADNTHVAWPVNFQSESQAEGGFCPEGWPIRLPGILSESVIDLTKYNGNYTLVLANGDEIGTGMHADFFNGWDIDVLQQAIDTVFVRGDTPFFSQYSDTSSVDIPAFNNPSKDLGVLLGMADSCRVEGPQVAGAVSKPGKQSMMMDSLPGCNLPWLTGPKPTC